MAQESGTAQGAALLETVPGIASVLRSPTADALVGLIRAAAGLGDFRPEDTRELIQFAVRRGLIGGDEGDRLTMEIQNAPKRTRVKAPVSGPRPAVRKAAAHKTTKRPPIKKAKSGKKRRA